MRISELQASLPIEDKPEAITTFRIAIAGNPNTGKTSLFNNITGARHKVANWPGVTVEKKEGRRFYKDYELEIVDLPGTYSLTAYSAEELIARDFILLEKPDVVIHVVDTTNLERNLYLYTQLVELKVKVVIALNMWDEAEEKGLRLDLPLFSELLGAPAIPTVARLNQNTEALLDQVIAVAQDKSYPRFVPISYGAEVNEEIRQLTGVIVKNDKLDVNPRWLAIKLLENDDEAKKSIGDWQNKDRIHAQVTKSQRRIETIYNHDAEMMIAQQRYGFVHGACQRTAQFPPTTQRTLTDRIDSILTHRILGFPIFGLFLWLLFQATFSFGAFPMDWIEYLITKLSDFIITFMADGPLRALLVDGIINGVGSVIIFLPNILILFFGIAIMEDTGYMARAAFLMDRIMRSVGLHGKAFIALVMGFGCNVPAIMSARTLENDRDRLLTILINPLMSCSARLPVYLLFAGAFFPESVAGNVIFVIYVIGIALAGLMGRLFSRSILKGNITPFVMELPPYRFPTLKSLFFHMWDRSSQYLKKMGGVIMVASIIIWFLGAYPKVETYSRAYDADMSRVQDYYAGQMEGQSAASPEMTQIKETLAKELHAIEAEKTLEEQRNTFIGRLGNFIEPALRPLGFDWRMGVSLITGFVAKEVVVSTLGVLYQIDDSDEGLQAALRHSGLTPLTAFAYMVFVLIYTPCLVAVIAIKRETGSNRWMWFAMIYELVLAWVVAFIVYQGGLLLGF